MMKTMKTRLYSLALLAAFSSFNAAANDFKLAEVAYATPPKISVYNDGRNTYIKAIPGLVVQGATADGDRLIVPGLPHEIQAWIGGRAITISQFTAPKSSTAPSPSATQIAQTINQKIAMLEKELEQKEKLQQAKDGQVLTKPTATAKPAAPAQVWEIRKSDGTLFGALSRWAAEAKPKRQLIYSTDGNDFPADPEATFTGDFDSAIAQVMESMRYSRYPLRACMWDNKPYPVVKIIHKNKRCED